MSKDFVPATGDEHVLRAVDTGDKERNFYEGFDGMNYEQFRKPYKTGAWNKTDLACDQQKGTTFDNFHP